MLLLYVKYLEEDILKRTLHAPFASLYLKSSVYKESGALT